MEILDKIERQDEQVTNAQLREFNASVADVRAWINGTRNNLLNPSHDRSWFTGTTLANTHELLHDHLAPRGLLGFVDVDFTIVGLVAQQRFQTRREILLAVERYDVD